MSRRLSRPRRVWAIPIVVMVTMVSVVLLADGFLGEDAPLPWPSRARRRAEAEALANGHTYLEEGRFRRAILTVSRIREGSASEAEALTIRGVAEASLEEVAPARRDLERAWSLCPNAAAGRVLAAIYLSANETDRGLQVLQATARIDSHDFRPWYAMGELVYLPLRRYDEAIEAFRRALVRRHDHRESRLGLIEALVRSHKAREAGPIIEGLMRDRPDDPRLLTLAAEAALDLGRDRDALSLVEQSLTMEPDHREALVLQARIRLKEGRPKEALSSAERACELNPNDPATLGLVGSIQAVLGLKRESEQTLGRRKEVERRNREMEELSSQILERPDDLELRCRLGRMASEAGMRSLAIQSYQAALSRSPNCEPAQRGLIDLGVDPSRVLSGRGGKPSG